MSCVKSDLAAYLSRALYEVGVVTEPYILTQTIFESIGEFEHEREAVIMECRG